MTPTEQLLKECRKAGYHQVAIARRAAPIRSCREYPFSTVEDSLFASPDIKIDGWPALWEIVREQGLHMGCGNGQQAQCFQHGLEPGVFTLHQGRWIRTEGRTTRKQEKGDEIPSTAL